MGMGFASWLGRERKNGLIQAKVAILIPMRCMREQVIEMWMIGGMEALNAPHLYCLFVTPRNSLHYLHAKDGSNNIKRKGTSVQSVRLRLVLGKRFFPSTWKKSSFPPQKNQLIFDFRGGQCNESLPRFLRHSFFVSKKSDTYFAHTKLIRSSSTGNEFYFILHRVRRDAMWTILDVL